MNHEFCSIAGSVTNLTYNDSPGGDRQSDRVKTDQYLQLAKSRPPGSRNRLPLIPQQRTFEFQNRRAVAKSRRSKARAARSAWCGFEGLVVTPSVTPGATCGPTGVEGLVTRHFRAVALWLIARCCELLRCGKSASAGMTAW